MKKIAMVLMMGLAAGMISCTSSKNNSVSDGVKDLIVQKSLMGKRVKLPKAASEGANDYKSTKTIVSFDVDSVSEVDGKTVITGEVVIPDQKKLETMITTVMMAGTKDMARVVASTHTQVDNVEGHKAVRMAKKYTAVVVKKDGKTWLESLTENK